MFIFWMLLKKTTGNTALAESYIRQERKNAKGLHRLHLELMLQQLNLDITVNVLAYPSSLRRDHYMVKMFLAGSCSAFCISMLNIDVYKNYISPDMPISNPSPIGWLLQPQPLRMNEIEIAGILHVQYRASAVLHCIILYQNGHSGSKPSENVSKCISSCLLQNVAELCRTV